MSLKSKFILILLAIFVLFTTADFLTDRFVVFPKFIELEHDEARKNLERAVRAIKREIHHLNSLCHDWSAWDETYTFVETPSDDYVKANLLFVSFKDNQINLIYILDKAGNMVWGETYDLDTKQAMEIPDFSKGFFEKDHPLTSYSVEEESLANSSVSGIFVTEKGLMMIASKPILTSMNKGPVRGTFIMGRLLNDSIIETLADQTQADFRIFPIRSDSMPESLKNIPNLITPESPYLIQETADEHLVIFTTFPDITGKAAFVIQSRISKRICAIGETALKYAFVSVVTAGLSVIIFMLILVQRSILLPVARLTRHALSVGETGDLSARVSMARGDEIGTLAREFDRMLAKLEDRTIELARVNETLKQDIFDREGAEEVLRNREKYYRSLLYSMHEEIIVVDKNHKITDANKNFLVIAGLSRDEVIGRYSFDVFKGFQELFDRRGKNRELSRVFKTGRPYKSRYEYETADGPGIWTDILMSPLSGEDDEITNVIIAIRDVSKEVQLENQLRQTQKMEAIGTLAGGIAHDFNNILMSIMINTEFALKKSQGNLPVYESLELSLKAGYRARDLVEQILTFSRETGKKRIPLSVSPIVKESLKMLRSSLPATIDISQHIEAGSDTVLAAPAQIHQILFNLCSNAAYSMRKNGGMLTVILAETLFDSDAGPIYPDVVQEDYLRLTVKDTGPGIPCEIIDRVFDPFFTTKGPGEGTGMGLAVVHGILSEMGGKIKVRSEPGHGAVFDVFLPRIEGKGGVSADVIPASSGGAGRLLVVDDEDFLVESLQKTLEDFGYHVVGETSSISAFNLFRQEPDRFDLVITDQAMPGMTGIELAEGLLSIRPEIPIILCTGFSETIHEEQVAALGIREFVQKPVVASELSDMINEILDMG